jgi:hypothetical protein
MSEVRRGVAVHEAAFLRPRLERRHCLHITHLLAAKGAGAVRVAQLHASRLDRLDQL